MGQGCAGPLERPFDTPTLTRYNPPSCGAVAQLGERLNGIQEVVGSIPIGSTSFLLPFLP
jgi:hypothetical protein